MTCSRPAGARSTSPTTSTSSQRPRPPPPHISPVHPIWMDVEDHNLYPVFNVLKGKRQGRQVHVPRHGQEPVRRPRAPLNEFTVDHPGTLIGDRRAPPSGRPLRRPRPDPPGGHSRPAARPRGTVPNSVRLFRSYAHYRDPRGPISWDMAMTATPIDWRPRSRPATCCGSARPMRPAGLVVRVDGDHGRLGGLEQITQGVDPFTPPSTSAARSRTVISPRTTTTAATCGVPRTSNKFTQRRRSQVADCRIHVPPRRPLTAPGAHPCIPTITQGSSLTFVNEDASAIGSSATRSNPNPAYVASIFHTITSCQNPCGLDTGISYPLANGAGGYDSGQLGAGLPRSGGSAGAPRRACRPGRTLLLPDPPVHAGRVPRYPVVAAPRLAMAGRRAHARGVR